MGMPSRAVIEDFLRQKRLAVVGVSRDSKEFTNGLFRKLRESGYEVVPVNRNASEVEGEPCYSSVRALPGSVDGVLVMVPGMPWHEIARPRHAPQPQHGSEQGGHLIVETLPNIQQPAWLAFTDSFISWGL